MQKTSGWYSWGIAYEKPFTCNDGKVITNKTWWLYIFEHKSFKFSFEEMKDNKDEVIRRMNIDLHFWLPNDILLKADKMSMANSVELRVPFLDKKVWELSSKIPTKYMVKDNHTKYIFRKVANKFIPTEWAKRKKLGFPVPFSKWIREKTHNNRHPIHSRVRGKCWPGFRGSRC